MQRTVVTLLAIVACASAASVAGKVKLNDDAKELVDSFKPLMDAKKIAKVVRLVASQGDNSRAFIVSLNGLSSEAQSCAMAQAKALEPQVKAKTLAAKDYPQAIINACPEYKDQLQTTWDAYQAAMPEMQGGSSTIFSDMPASVQALATSYTKLSQEIQADPTLVKTPATFGPKVKALTDEFRAISEADRQAVVAKLDYTKEFLLPSGSHYADLNEILDYVDAKAAGQQVDDSAMKAKGQALQSYVMAHANEWFDFVNEEIDDATVAPAIAQDGQVNKVAAAIGKMGAQYAKMLFAQPKFNTVLNAAVVGDADSAQAAVEASV